LPHKIPKLGGKQYGRRWRAQRAATLRSAPLCALCLASNRITPAVIVDHKVPLSDGGTNAQDNLQPLCKLCHDAVKTPADRRTRALRPRVTVIALWLDSPCPASVLDLRPIRDQAGDAIGWREAHNLMLAAAEGVAAFLADGKREVAIAIDDAAAALHLRSKYNIAAAVEPAGAAPARGEGARRAFIDTLYSSDYAARHGRTQGEQPSRAGTD